MKVKIAKQADKFEPIKLTITIETPEELCDLWLRQNISGQIIDKHNGCYLKHNATQYECNNIKGSSVFWDVLDNLIGERKLRVED